jgi:ABC-type amino acid transport substrate-binding protein/two-component sensor histidine kinase
MPTKIIKRCIVLLLLTLCFSTTAYPQTANPKSDTLLIKEKLNYPPYSFVNEEGIQDGFNIDLVKAIMQDLDIPYKIELASWNEVKAGLSNGSTDVTSMVFSPERDSLFYFSSIYSTIRIDAVFNKKSQPIRSLNQLKNKVVAIEDGSITLDIIKAAGCNANVVLVSDLEEAIIGLSKGKYNAVVCDVETSGYIIRKHGLKNLAASDLGLPPRDYCFSAKNKETIEILNKGLTDLIQNGEYSRIHDKWLKRSARQYVPERWYILIFFLLFAVIISFVTIEILNKRVKKYNEALSTTLKELRMALDAGGIGVWMFDPESKKFNNIEGTQFIAEGTTGNEAIKHIHPDDREMVKKAYADIIEGKIDKTSIQFRLLNSADGNWHNINQHLISEKNRNGKVRILVGSDDDITGDVKQRKEQESLLKKLETIFTSSSIGLMYYDKDMYLVDLNQKAAETLCVKDKNDWIGKSNLKNDLFIAQYANDPHPEPHTDIVKIDYDNNPFLKKAIAEGKTPPTNKTGIHYYEMFFNPIYDKDGDLDSVVLSATDVTPIMESQTLLEDEKAKAQEADRQKSAFLANMSHDIRTPLNAILGFTSLALDTESKEEKEEYIKIVNTNSELLMNLINDILDISKIEAGTMDFHPKDVDFSTSFNDLTESLKSNLTNPDIEFIVDNPYPECKVVLDFNRVAQIISNFTTNAIKHTEKGHIKVGYSYEDDGIKVYVEDTGSGIPEEQHEKVFQRFMKLDSVQGTGLGLAICKAITDRCGGRIGFDSKVGDGSTFWAWIPAERVE